jgi:hypothetical protein
MSMVIAMSVTTTHDSAIPVLLTMGARNTHVSLTLRSTAGLGQNDETCGVPTTGSPQHRPYAFS